MKEFKSSSFIIVKNLIYGIVGAFLVGLICSWFFTGYIPYIAATAVFLFMTYTALHGDNIHVTLDEEKLIFYRRDKVLHEFDVKDCAFKARIVTKDNDSDCYLTVIKADQEEVRIDCSMLGRSRFMKLLDALDVN